MLIYISAPYSKGDVSENIRRACFAGDELLAKGHQTFIPHLSHLWHLISPKSYEEWLRIGIVWLDYCDAVLRLDGFSIGADEEVAYAYEKGLFVYYNIDDIPNSVSIIGMRLEK